jgi:hypothetical protein
MHPPVSLTHLAAESIEQDRHRGEGRRHDQHRALLDAPLGRQSRLDPLRAAVRNALAPEDHALTDYPCRLPDGRIGRVAVVFDQGEWTIVCRVR